MDRWEIKPSRDQDRYNRHHRENPSFSSTLLDAIYRSIDEPKTQEELIFYKETMRKKQSNNGFKQENRGEADQEMARLQRACMVEKWMQKKVISYEKVDVRRKSMVDFDKKTRKDFEPVLLNSSSSSSESSCGGGFSSSESESIYTTPRSKPTGTSINAARAESHRSEIFMNHDQGQRNYAPTTQKPKQEGTFVKTKSKALKIYGDLKKVKQPISPGGRLASFLNSLFTTGDAKKAKISSSSSGYGERRVLKSGQESSSTTCSSASSFSRSCLSKTPLSSRDKLSNNGGAKRSVRFYPVSVIVDEDCRPCGHKNLHGNEESTLFAVAAATRNPTNEELKFHVINENRRVQEVARDILMNYHSKKEEFDSRNRGEDDDDAASCSSSDLFELDNLSAIGMERYCQELPVYETTHLNTNRAIANGLIL